MPERQKLSIYFTNIFFCIFMNHEEKIQSSEKKTQIDRSIRSLSQLSEKKKK